jgi:predicted naringenin-chalcone synthase
MSSVTVFFVLRELLDRGKKGKLFSCAFGPGLTVESAFLEVL